MQHFLQGMEDNKLHHAWLLYGPQGIGKASLGWAMAGAYLCDMNRQGSKSGMACGKCHGCKMLKEKAHPDFLYVERELDKQGKKKKRDIIIDQVRALMSFLSLSGSESDRRVVLVDEASLLNQQAANALLKGLEEPAAGSLLLLACDDMMRLPATVRSRCLLERLSPLSEEHCSQALQHAGLSGEALSLGIELAAGRPGSVICFKNQEVIAALLQWQQLTRDLAASDIGAIQEWLAAHAMLVPHQLIVRVVLLPVYEYLQIVGAFTAHQAVIDAAWAVAEWPKRVARHSLRAAPSLLAHMLGLRIALRHLQNAG